MALLFMDGYEHLVTADLAEKYDSVSSGSVSTSYARTGSASLNASGYVGVALNPTGLTAIWGGGMYSISSSSYIEFGYGGFAGAANAQLTVQLQGDGSLAVKRGVTVGTELGRTAAGVFRFSVWNYLEIKVTFDNSTGTVTLKLNGVEVLALTGKDTVQQTEVAWNCMRWGGGGYYDDVYICDGNGSQNNDFLGQIRVVALKPQTNGH